MYKQPNARFHLPRAIALAACLLGAMIAVLQQPASAQRAGPGPVGEAAERIFSSRPGETRALIVRQDGKTIFERYGAGFDASTRFVSWSAGKTVLAAAVGILAAEWRIDPDRAAPVQAWRAPGDPRGTISVRHLLTMTAGLDHREGGEGGMPIETADTVRMLFAEGGTDTVRYAASRSSQYPPGTHWRYSTGSSQILADIVSRAITQETEPAARRRAVAAWFDTRMFAPIGVTSATWDFDAAGLFLGGSMLHMTANDYGRIGELFLARGLAPDGKVVFPPGWLDVLTTPAGAVNNGNYAGHLWINARPAAGQPNAMFAPHATPATFAMIGHLGQFVIVVPEKKAVIVRLGKTANKDRPALRDELGMLVDALEPRR